MDDLNKTIENSNRKSEVRFLDEKEIKVFPDINTDLPKSFERHPSSFVNNPELSLEPDNIQNKEISLSDFISSKEKEILKKPYKNMNYIEKALFNRLKILNDNIQNNTTNEISINDLIDNDNPNESFILKTPIYNLTEGEKNFKIDLEKRLEIINNNINKKVEIMAFLNLKLDNNKETNSILNKIKNGKFDIIKSSNDKTEISVKIGPKKNNFTFNKDDLKNDYTLKDLNKILKDFNKRI